MKNLDNNIKLLRAKVEELKALCDPCGVDVEVKIKDCDINSLENNIDCLREELKYIYQYLYKIDEDLWKHKTEGHIPKIPSVSAMKKAIDVLGLSDEYKIEPKYIYASDGTKNLSELSIKIINN